MKNQYFGDNRDLFKYDLAFQIIRAGLVARFTFIPMLTRNDNQKHGADDKRAGKPGADNRELVDFLDRCRREEKKDIREIKKFFVKHKIDVTIYREKEYFNHARREPYFSGISPELLADSLVLVDPDIGLEVNRPREKHLLYTEVGDLYQRMIW